MKHPAVPITNIRPATLVDVPPMLALDHQVYHAQWWFDVTYATALWQRNPKVYRMLELDHQIRGYSSILPLNEAGYQGLIQGTTTEQSLMAYVQAPDATCPLFLYFDSLVIDPTLSHASLYAAQLIRDAMQQVQGLANHGDVRRLVAMPVSPPGWNLVRKMGWTFVASPQGVPFYETTIIPGGTED